MSDFTKLELAAAHAITRQLTAEADVLLAQLNTATVTSREFTGQGFFTEFEVDRSLPPISSSQSPVGWVASQVGPDGYELEFMVFVRDGYAVLMEAYSFGDGYGDLDLLTAAFTPPRPRTQPPPTR